MTTPFLRNRSAAAAVLALVVAACDQAETRAEELGAKADRAIDSADAALAEAGARLDAEVDRLQELFRGKREDALVGLESRLEGIRERLEGAVADLRSRGERDGERLMEELSVQRAAAATRLEELRTAGEESWRELCRDLERESADLEARLRELADDWKARRGEEDPR
jgi:hypothetical protein